MDGMFVAYHNTQELFGFEYIPLEDIDRCVSGSPFFAQTAFNICTRVRHPVFFTLFFRCVRCADSRILQALREVLAQITADTPADMMRVAFATASASGSAHMDIYVETIPQPAEWPHELGVLKALAGNGPVDESVGLRKYRLSFAVFVNGQRSEGQLKITPVRLPPRSRFCGDG
jgi:hypothetical protein